MQRTVFFILVLLAGLLVHPAIAQEPQLPPPTLQEQLVQSWCDPLPCVALISQPNTNQVAAFASLGTNWKVPPTGSLMVFYWECSSAIVDLNGWRPLSQTQQTVLIQHRCTIFRFENGP